MDSIDHLTVEQLDKLIVRFLRQHHDTLPHVTATTWKVYEPGTRSGDRTLEATGSCPACGRSCQYWIQAGHLAGEPGPKNDFRVHDVRSARSLHVTCSECLSRGDDSVGGVFVLTRPAEAPPANAAA